jgi:hypothetical protein
MEKYADNATYVMRENAHMYYMMDVPKIIDDLKKYNQIKII